MIDAPIAKKEVRIPPTDHVIAIPASGACAQGKIVAECVVVHVRMVCGWQVQTSGESDQQFVQCDLNPCVAYDKNINKCGGPSP